MTGAAGEATPVRVGSVANALAILRHLATTDRAHGVNAIARAVGISPSSCFNILKTLVAEDFARFDDAAKTYAMGAGAVDLAIAALDPDASFSRVAPALERIAGAFGVTCALWRRQGERMTLIGTVEARAIARIRFSPGQRLPVMIGAMGRCVAAHDRLAEGALADAVASLRWNAAPAPGRYLQEVRAAAATGYAIDDGDFLAGVTSVAAPVIGREGGLTHCLVATTFKGGLAPAALGELGEALREAAWVSAPLLGVVR